MEIKVKIIDPLGIHARPAAPLSKEANKFKSNITITGNNKCVNLKSILSVMSLGIKNGQIVTITAEGDDQQEALKTIERVMKEHHLI